MLKKIFPAAATLLCALVSSGAEYIRNGSFTGIEYAPEVQRHKLQPGWTLTPNTYHAFKLVKDVEADAVRAHIKVQTPGKPALGYDQLRLMAELSALPDKPAKVSFRARGDGKIAAYVFEYLQTAGKRKFLRRAATFQHVELTPEWKTYTFDYVPGKGELGQAILSFNFQPAKGDKVNIDVTGVSITAPEVKRDPVPGRLVIPKLAKAPVIDGAVDPDEWKQAIHVSGFKQLNNHIPAPGDTRICIGYDDRNLYVGITAESGDKPVAKATERDSALYREDSVETILSDMENNRFAQIIVSSRGVLFDADGRKANPTKWNIDIKAAARSSDTGWSAELAIPRAELPFNPAENQPFKLNFFQNDVIQGAMARTIYSVWAKSDRTGESRPAATQDFPVAVLSPDRVSAAVNTSSKGDLVLSVNNPGKPCELFCEYGTENAHKGTLVVTAPQGVSVHPVPFTPQNELAVVAVRDASGNELYRNAENFKYELESYLGLKKYLPKNYVELTSAITGLAEYRLLWTLGDVAKGEFKVSNGKPGPMPVGVEKLEVSKSYPLTVRIVDGAGNSMGKRIFEVVRPPVEPWADSQLGITDQPLPPFRAIRAEGDALEFLMQRYEYQDRALPVSVKSENHEILAAPVTLKLNGEDLADKVARKIVSKKPNRVEWQGENAAARWSAWSEEDGFTWYTVTIKKAPGKSAENLMLDIPVKKEFASFLSPVPFFRSGGDMDGRYCYDFKPWVSMDFKQIVTLRNDDRGIELVAEDDRGFSRRELGGSHRLIPDKDRVTIRMTIIDKPVELDKERTYSFGIQAFPAKPFRLQPGSLANADYVDPRTAAWSGGFDKALIRLPLRGKHSGGTIEFNAYWDFEPNFIHPDYHVRPYLGQTLFSFGSCGLRWDPAEGGFLFRDGKRTLKQSGPVPVIAKGWHNLALTLEGEQARVFVDGKPVAEFTAPGVKQKFAEIVLGKGEKTQHADFHYDSVKYTAKVLAPAELGKAADKDTVFFQSFQPGAPGKYTASGTLRTVKTDRGERLSASGEYFTRLDAAEAVGIKNMLGYLNRIFQFYGPPPWGYRCLPYTNEEGYKAYGILIDDLTRRGIELYYGFSFGYRVNSHEDKFYRDYYSIQPGRLYGNDISGFYCMCAGCLDYSNSFLYHVNNLLDRYDNQHIYTDNLFICGRECSNLAHGCGSLDEHGQLKMTGNMLNGRRFAKRLYAVTKLRAKPREHYMHSSGCNHALYMSWADKYLCGEQYLENTTKQGWDIDLGQYRAQNVATCFGVPAISISTFVPFGMKGMIAVAALHNCGTSGASHHQYPQGLFQYKDFLKVTAGFGIHDAEFLPYYRNGDVVRTDQDKREFASVWKKPGKALVAVSNLKWQAASVAVTLDFAKLGVKGKVRNAVTGQEVAADASGRVTLDIPAYDAVYLLAE